jgi:formiminotetrahydrofolate cyclodeaminase
VDEVLMDLVVTLAATIDELGGVDDRYERELLHVLESVAAELEKLNSDDRRAFAAHVEAMSARAAADPLVSAEYRQFLGEFPTSFGLIENMH